MKMIRILSPSATVVDEPEGKELMQRAEQLLRAKYDISHSHHANGKRNYLSGTAEERAADIMEAFTDPTVFGILSTQGGNNSNDLLDLLDYKKISANKKPFFGLSDITVLLNVIALKSKITTYHGVDLIWGIGKNATEYTLRAIDSVLMEDKAIVEKNPKTPAWKTVQKGSAEGVLLGGCLPSFCLLLGTKYDPLVMLDSPYILFLEDIGQTKSEIHSMLRQIRQHAKFNLCGGIILGSFFSCNQKPAENDIPIESIAKEVFENIPIVRIEEIGHCVENIIIPVGAKARLHCTDTEVKLQF